MTESYIDEINIEGCSFHKQNVTCRKYSNSLEHSCSEYPDCPVKHMERKEKQLEKYALCINKINNINNDLLNSLCNNCAWYHTDGCNPEDFTCGVLLQIKQLINGVENALDSN